MTSSVRGLRCGDGFRVALADHVRGRAVLARQVERPSGDHRRHSAAVEALADYIAAAELGDHRLVALSSCSATQGGTRMRYRPGPEQDRLIARVGLDGSAPDPADALDELVAAGITDVISIDAERMRHATDAQSRAQAQAARLTARAERGEAAENELGVARAQISRLEVALTSLREEHEFLRLLTTNDAAPRISKPDATAVKGTQ
jgi:hypothetical protein